MICYASRTLSRAERNYCCTRRELLAVVFFVKHFRAYLLGKKFLIRTDHSALTWLRKTPEPIGQQARWCEQLEEYDFEIQHRPGRAHGNADALSRKPCRQCGFGEEEKPAVEARTIVFNAAGDIPESIWNPEQIAEATTADEELSEILEKKKKGDPQPPWETVAGRDQCYKNYVSQWDRIIVKDGRLFRVWWTNEGVPESLQLIPPRSYRQEIVRIAHAGYGGGHLGVKKTKAKVQRRAYWSGWASDVEVYLRECQECAQYFRGKVRRQGEMQHTPVGLPWEKIAIDICGPFPKSKEGMMYIFSIIDCFTKFSFAIPTRNHEAVTLANILVDRVFAEYGIPLQIVSDLGPELQGNLMTEMCRALGIDKMRTSAYRPQGNSQVERWHRTLNSLLGKVVSESQRDWPARVPGVVAAYRATIHESTGFTPNRLLFGRETHMPLDLAYGVDAEEAQRSDSYDHYVSDMQDRLRQDYALAREHLGKSVRRNKKSYDLRTRPQQYTTGTWVWYYYPRRYAGRSPKLQRMYTGPFLIVKILGQVNVVLQKSARSNPFISHIDKLKKCLGQTPKDWRAEEDRVSPEDTPNIADLLEEGIEEMEGLQEIDGDRVSQTTPGGFQVQGNSETRDAPDDTEGRLGPQGDGVGVVGDVEGREEATDRFPLLVRPRSEGSDDGMAEGGGVEGEVDTEGVGGDGVAMRQTQGGSDEAQSEAKDGGEGEVGRQDGEEGKRPRRQCRRPARYCQ